MNPGVPPSVSELAMDGLVLLAGVVTGFAVLLLAGLIVCGIAATLREASDSPRDGRARPGAHAGSER